MSRKSGRAINIAADRRPIRGRAHGGSGRLAGGSVEPTAFLPRTSRAPVRPRSIPATKLLKARPPIAEADFRSAHDA